MLQNENLWHQEPFFAVQNNINFFSKMKYRIKITKKNIWNKKKHKNIIQKQ